MGVPGDLEGIGREVLRAEWHSHQIDPGEGDGDGDGGEASDRDQLVVRRPFGGEVGDERLGVFGARRSSTSNVIAMANTASLNASTRPELLALYVSAIPASLPLLSKPN